MSAQRTPGPANTHFASPAASLRSLSQQLEDERRTPPPTAASGRAGARPAVLTRQAGATQQNLLAAKDAEVTLLRQQLAQLTADFRYNLKLLEERDLELERTDAVIVGLKEAASTRELAAQEAQRAAVQAQAALREREASLAALEERHRSSLELCDCQVADARAARDEEVARIAGELAALQAEAAREKSDTIARYEEQLSAAVAAEHEARQRSQQLAEENEHVRSMLQRAEARVAEQELGMQRMVGQFEGALQTLQQLEAQYDSLAADAGAAEQLRISRIRELEAEVEGLRSARSSLQQERDSTAASLQQRLAESDKALGEARQRYHRAMMDNADLTEALAGLKQEVQELRGRCKALETELAGVREEHRQATAALERESGTHEHTQGLVESMRVQLEGVRRELAAAQQEAATLRQAATLLEAQCNDSTQALEAAHAKLAAAEERTRLMGQQLEEERSLHAQQLSAREAEAEARWSLALQTAQQERGKLQETLDLANRQLQAAHRDVETLRLQLEHLRLAPAPPLAVADHHLHPGPDTSSFTASLAHTADDQRQLAEASVAETAASEGSRDVFADLPDYPAPAAQQPSTSSGSSGPYQHRQQQQLHQRIDSLADKLSGFERTVQQASKAGSQAAQQLEESSRAMPEALQRRQAQVVEAADERVRRSLAQEREQYQQERRLLDQQLAEQQRQVQEQQRELQRLQQAGLAWQQDMQDSQQQQQQQLAQPQAYSLQQAAVHTAPQGAVHLQSTGQQRSYFGATEPQTDQLAAENAALRHQLASLRLSSLGPSPAASSLAPSSTSPGLSAGLGGTAAIHRPAGPRWQPGLAGAAPAAPLGSLGVGAGRQASHPAALSSRPATGSTYSSALRAVAAADGPADDPLAKARQQVQQAKEYLRHAANLGSRLSSGS